MVSINRLKNSFLYRYHRLPGYIQAKRTKTAFGLRKAGWQLQELWDKTLSRREPLAGKSREEVKRLLFKEDAPAGGPVAAHHAPPAVVESYRGYDIYSLEGRFYGLPREAGPLDVALLRGKKYDWYSVGHTVPDVRQDIDKAVAGRSNPAPGAEAGAKEKALFLCNVAPDRVGAFLDKLRDYDLTLLTLKGADGLWPEYPRIGYADAAGNEAEEIDVNNTSPELLRALKERNFDLVVAPYEGRKYWDGINVEMFVPAFANRLVVMFPDGKTRSYKGEDINRITYNKAYLNQMFRFVPPLKGKRVLEVGCSDGLACDLLLPEDPDLVVGVDSMEAVGCNYTSPKINYFRMDASDLTFKDEAFDLTYSLATLEHVPDPFAVLQEMKRVTRRGGYCVAQAGPLYFSPFGHHMFGYFDDYPWIHLRLSADEIVDYAERRQIDEQIRGNRGLTAREYVGDMLRPEHINGLRLRDYRLAEFVAQPDVKVLRFSYYYEGKELLTDDIRRELARVDEEDLTTSGFELIFKVR